MKVSLLICCCLGIVIFDTKNKSVEGRIRYPTHPDIKVISAAYFRELDGVYAYETTAKIVFAVKLPDFQVFSKAEQNGRTWELVHNTSIELTKRFKNYLRSFDRSKQRNKRQVVLGLGLAGGFLFHSIYTKIEHKLMGTEDEAAFNLRRIQETLRNQQQEFLYFKHDIQKFADKMTVTMKKFYRQITDQEQIDVSLLHLSQLGFGITNIQQGLERCVHRLIPVQLLSDEVLENQLQHLEITLQNTGYHLAISTSYLVTFEKMPLADCFVTDSTAYILVNVPLRKTNWSIREMIPIPFAFSNQTCHLHSPSVEIVAISKDSLRIIDPYMLRFCDLLHDHLCLVPEFFRPSTKPASCAESLFKGSGKQDFITDCQFECTNNTQLLYNQVGKGKIVATNAHEISIECPEAFYDYKVKPIGSVEIEIKCHCKYVINTDVFNGTGICFTGNFSTKDAVHVVPHFLTFSENDKLLPKTWPKNVPVLNFHHPNAWNETDVDSLTSLHYRDWWLLVLSICITILLTALFIACYCLYKLR